MVCQHSAHCCVRFYNGIFCLLRSATRVHRCTEAALSYVQVLTSPGNTGHPVLLVAFTNSGVSAAGSRVLTRCMRWTSRSPHLKTCVVDMVSRPCVSLIELICSVVRAVLRS